MPDRRKGRGRLLAQEAGQRIRLIEGSLWFVPSERTGGYLVNVEAATCSCPDGQRGTKCKHRWALEYVQSSATGADGDPAAPAPSPVVAKVPPRGDLTADEVAHVRAALRFLRVRSKGWDALVRGTRFKLKTLQNTVYGRPPSASLAIRLARFAGVPIDDLLAGRFPPPGACPHCGRGPE